MDVSLCWRSDANFGGKSEDGKSAIVRSQVSSCRHPREGGRASENDLRRAPMVLQLMAAGEISKGRRCVSTTVEIAGAIPLSLRGQVRLDFVRVAR